jgi:hypothetical protein
MTLPESQGTEPQLRVCLAKLVAFPARSGTCTTTASVAHGTSSASAIRRSSASAGRCGQRLATALPP